MTNTPHPNHARRAAMIAGLAGALAVATGAFGAHGLKDALTPERLAWWYTGADYHLAHALLLVGLALHAGLASTNRHLRWAFVAVTSGIAIFSGSLYAMALTEMRWLGAVTPIGGSAFIAGWVLVAIGLNRNEKPRGAAHD